MMFAVREDRLKPEVAKFSGMGNSTAHLQPLLAVFSRLCHSATEERHKIIVALATIHQEKFSLASRDAFHCESSYQ